MRYKESREQTAELLRMVVPQMVRHEAGLHPMNYAVWYEYLAGFNPRLSAALDARLAQRNCLTDADVVELYEQYVDTRDVAASAQVRADIARLVEQVDGAASDATREVRHFGQELDVYRLQLQGQIAPEELDQVVQSLILDTSRVRDTTELFNEQLRKSSQEVERLRGELEIAQGLALRDPLTGLLNRRGFDLHWQRDWSLICADSKLLVIDIDQFKAINDAHGHLLGDKVIVAVARVLHTCVGDRGPVARIGGEEFAALLLHSDDQQAMTVAEQIRGAIERGRIRRSEDAQSIGGVTVSVGVAGSLASEPFEALMLRADRALYRSKTEGRNRITMAEVSAKAG